MENLNMKTLFIHQPMVVNGVTDTEFEVTVSTEHFNQFTTALGYTAEEIADFDNQYDSTDVDNLIKYAKDHNLPCEIKPMTAHI